MAKVSIKHAAAGLALVLSLTACGGGGGGTSSGGATPVTTLSGTVIDGYIEGATICLDLNVNQVCDAGEPMAISTANGAYSLSLAGLGTAQVRAAHLLTTVPNTAFDADDTVLGVKKTLAQAGKQPFNLLAPVNAYLSADGFTATPAIISPLTTLVSHEMIVGNNKPLADAEAAVRNRMSLPSGTDLRQDFVARNETSLRQQAQVIAIVFGEVKKSAGAVSGTSDRDAVFAALAYLQQNMAALQTATAGGTTPSSILAKVQTALATPALSPTPSTLIDTAQTFTTSSPTDILSLLVDGMYSGGDLFCQETYCLNYARYVKMYRSNSNVQIDSHAFAAGGWSLRAPSSESTSHYLASTGWVPVSPSQSISIASDGQGGGTATSTGSGLAIRFTSRVVDVSNKSTSDVAGLNLPTNAPAFTFPTGSKVYWMQTTSLTDRYVLYTDHQLSTADGSTSVTSPVDGIDSSVETKFTSLSEFLAAYATGSETRPLRYFSNAGVSVSFDAGGTSTGGTVSIWGSSKATCNMDGYSYTSSASVDIPKTGNATFDIKTVSGQQVLIINTQAPCGYPEKTFLAVKDGKLFQGSYTAAGLQDRLSLEFNKTAFNKLLTAAGRPAVLN